MNFDFSGLNGPNDIEVDERSPATTDVYTLGNFGTNNVLHRDPGPAISLTVLRLISTNADNTATYNFGSGAYDIIDMFNHGGHDLQQHCRQTGRLWPPLTATDTVWALWAVINMIPARGRPYAEALTFTAATGISSVDTVPWLLLPPSWPVFRMALATLPAHHGGIFRGHAGTAGNTFVFAHADASTARTRKRRLGRICGPPPHADNRHQTRLM